MNKKRVLFSLITALVILCGGVSLQAESTESLMSQGNMLLANGAFDQAVSAFRKVMARDPSNFEAQFNLAFAYLNWGRHSNAVTEFTKAVRLNPSSAEAWSNLAMAYQNLGKSGKAVDALYRAVQNNPNNITARINLATMYGQNHQLDKAIAQYKQVLQIDGTNLDATTNLAKCYISKGKYKEAKHYLKSATVINPNDAEAYWEFGNVLWNSDKDSKGAITNYKKAIALQSNSQVYYENYALLLEELWKKNKDESKRQEAIDVWKKSLIYLDDALKKENVQSRLDLLERGESPTGKVSPDELFERTTLTKEESVSRTEGEGSGSTQRINVEGYDVSSDMSGLDESGGGSFDFDMDKAMKKKKEQQGLEEPAEPKVQEKEKKKKK